MNTIGKPERASQNRVVQLFQSELDYSYLGDWQEEQRTQPVEEELLFTFLTHKQGYSEVLARKAVDEFIKAANNVSDGLYEANKQVYKLLRYGVTVKEGLVVYRALKSAINEAEYSLISFSKITSCFLLILLISSG